MGIQKKAEREKDSVAFGRPCFSWPSEIKGLVKPFFSDRPVMKGTVYELKRKCGKPGCKCAQGELHARMVVSASEGGKTQIAGHSPRVSRVRFNRRCDGIRSFGGFGPGGGDLSEDAQGDG